jgi:N-acetylglucosamine kinase-like BadF-type ATPase
MRKLLRKFPDHVVLAVDGGASKADVALVDRDGRVLAAARRAGSYHFGLDHEGARDTLTRTVGVVAARAGRDGDLAGLAEIGVFCLAGADIAIDDRRISAELEDMRWSHRTIVRNDTFAVLRAGTDRAWGVAVVCGTGMNCAGIGPDGKSVRFPSFGELSGDRAHGGGWLGRTALGAAIRARDGRGPRSKLETLVPGYFKMARPTSVMEAIYVGRLDYDRLSELAPLVFTAADRGDAVARAIIDEMADEIVVTVNAAIRRLHVSDRDVHIVLGGGVLRAGHRRLLERIHAGVTALAPAAVIRRLEAPPVVGAALLGLDAMGAPAAARKRLRASLTEGRLVAWRQVIRAGRTSPPRPRPSGRS